MSADMLRGFLDWAREALFKSKPQSIEARITESEASGSPSARLDVDTPAAVARITFWESGDYVAEVIDLETGRTLFSDHGQCRDGAVFSKQFAPFLKSLDITIE